MRKYLIKTRADTEVSEMTLKENSLHGGGGGSDLVAHILSTHPLTNVHMSPQSSLFKSHIHIA